VARFRVFVETTFSDLQRERAILEPLGAEVVGREALFDRDLMGIAQEADALICQRARITRNVINHLRRCRIIVRYGIGTENVDVEAATDQGIVVSNVPDYCVEEVADHTIALLLTLARRLFDFDRGLRAGDWDDRVAPLRIHRIRGRTLGLIGLGRIGRAVASRARAFGLVVLAHDPYLPSELDGSVRMVDLDELLRASDFVSLHVPETHGTLRLVGERELRLMRKEAYLINTARGAVIDEEALKRAVAEKWIAGAGLDVSTVEPIRAGHALLDLPNTVVTPHVAYFSIESLAEVQIKAAEEVARVLLGKSPRSAVNPEVLRRLRGSDSHGTRLRNKTGSRHLK
jgi:D-3-phosphoglycerate dehydrogenase